MPAKSKAQFRFMQAIVHGDLKKAGLSPEKAKEFVEGVKYQELPKQKKPPRFKGLIKPKA